MEDKIQPELKDIYEMLNRYKAVNKNDVVIIFSVIGFDKEGEVDNSKSRISVYGEQDCLKISMEEIKKIINKKTKGKFINY